MKRDHWDYLLLISRILKHLAVAAVAAVAAIYLFFSPLPKENSPPPAPVKCPAPNHRA